MHSDSIDSSVEIHPSAIIEGDVKIGQGTTIGPYSYLKGPLIIGDDNQIGTNVQIGVDPEQCALPKLSISVKIHGIVE